MKIILAPDSFKDCLSGIDVCSILAEAARRELGDVEIRSFPMGDGGEGTLEAVLAATGGRRETLLVRDPLGRRCCQTARRSWKWRRPAVWSGCRAMNEILC